MKKIIRNGYLIIMFGILYLPIIYLMAYSFNSKGNMQSFGTFTLKYYKELFSDVNLLQTALRTFFLAFLSALIATFIGVFASLWIFYLKKKTQKLVLQLNNILLVSPDIVIGISFLILFTILGFKLGFVSVLMSHIAFSIPIVVIMMLPAVFNISSSLIDVAYDLGANSLQVLWKVVLPSLTSSIIVAYFMAFTYSLDDFAVTFFVTGNGFQTLSVDIYSRARQGIQLEINALSTILFIFSIILVFIYYFISKDTSKDRSRN